MKTDFECDHVLRASVYCDDTGPAYIAIKTERSGLINLEKRELMALLTLINQKEEQIKTQLKRDEK